MFLSPLPNQQQVIVRVRDPSTRWRRAAVCIFSFCLACVTVVSLNVFKRNEDSLVQSKSSLQLKDALLLHSLAPIRATGNELHSLKDLKLKSRESDDSLLEMTTDSSTAGPTNSESLAQAEKAVKSVADQDEEVQRQIDAVLHKAAAVSVKQSPPVVLKKQGATAVVVPSAPAAPKMAPLSKETREAMQAGEEAGREADEAAKARAQVEAAENYRQLRKAMYAAEREEERKERESRASQKGLTISQGNDELLKDLDSVYAHDPTATAAHRKHVAAAAAPANATGLHQPKPSHPARHTPHQAPPVRSSPTERPALPTPVSALPPRRAVEGIAAAPTTKHVRPELRPEEARVRRDAEATAEAVPWADAVATLARKAAAARAVPAVDRSKPVASGGGLAGIVSGWLRAL